MSDRDPQAPDGERRSPAMPDAERGERHSPAMADAERGERLQKVIARAGIASRRKSEKLIVSGKVTVNNKVVVELGTRVQPSDEVRVEGTLLQAERSRYYLLNKPRGMVTTLSDPEGRPCVGDLCLELPVRVFPVGRLDYDAEGLILLTNDGELAEKISHPRNHVARIYEAKVRGNPDPAILARLEEGIRLEDGRARAKRARLLRRTRNNTWLEIVVAEGRNHLVKRLCSAVGHPVQRLRRVQVGELTLRGLEPGKIREIDMRLAGLATLVGGTRDRDADETRAPHRRVRPPHLASFVLLLLFLGLGGACADDVVTSSLKLREESSEILRAAAADRLGELGGAEALRVLSANGIRDKAPRVRAASIRALERQHHPRLIDLYGDLLFDPAEEVQMAAAHALAKRGDARALRTLELAYGRSPLRGRLAIAAALSEAGASPQRTIGGWAERRLNALLAAVRSESVAERMGAAEELGRSGRPEAVAALLPMLAERSVGVAAAAARGLGWSGERRAVTLLAALLDEPYPQLRRDAARALARIGDPSALPALARAVADADDPTAVIFVQTMKRLARLDDTAGRAALCKALVTAPGPHAATAAASALRALVTECPAAAAALSDRLLGRNANLHAALAAIEGIQGAGLDARGRGRVEALIRGDDPRVGGAALAALAALDPEGSREAARSTLADLVEQQRLAREEWVPETLPTHEDWYANDESEEAVGLDDAYALIGMESGKAYGTRFGDLMARVASLRARREVNEATRKGLRPVDLDQATRENLQALTEDSAAPRVELIDDRPTEVLARLATASRALGYAGEASVDTELLLKTLKANEGEVRRSVALALEHLGPGAGPQVMEILDQIESPEVMAPLARLIDAAKVPGAEIASRIPSIAETARGPLFAVLAARGGPEAQARLIEALDASVTVAPAATALGILGTPGALAALEAQIRSGEPRGRVEAFRALALRRASPTHAEALALGLHDRSAEVRVIAGQALRGRQGPARVWVEALQKDYDISVRRAVSDPPEDSAGEGVSK